MIRAVVFDLDNTLYDYDSCHSSAMTVLCNYACVEYNLTEEQFEDCFSKARDIVKKQLGNTASSHNRMLYMQVFLENIGRLPASGALDLYDKYWDAMLEKMMLYPYVIPLMNFLRHNNIRIALLSDLTAHIQHRKIRKLGLTEYIDVLVTSEEVGEEKPSKNAFDLVKRKLGYPSNEMLMIGDSQSKDIDGAKLSGMDAILFTKDHASNMNNIVFEYINGKL